MLTCSIKAVDSSRLGYIGQIQHSQNQLLELHAVCTRCIFEI